MKMFIRRGIQFSLAVAATVPFGGCLGILGDFKITEDGTASDSGNPSVDSGAVDDASTDSKTCAFTINGIATNVAVGLECAFDKAGIPSSPKTAGVVNAQCIGHVACAKTGDPATCVGPNGTDEPRRPVEERCDTPIDDNCDGQINEGCECVPTDVQPDCGVGACAGGKALCLDAGGGKFKIKGCSTDSKKANVNCSSAEDNNCNGAADNREGICKCDGTVSLNDKGDCQSGALGICAKGTKTCTLTPGTTSSVTWSACVGGSPSAEGPFGSPSCTNGVDDDCDGLADGAEASCAAPIDAGDPLQIVYVCTPGAGLTCAGKTPALVTDMWLSLTPCPAGSTQRKTFNLYKNNGPNRKALGLCQGPAGHCTDIGGALNCTAQCGAAYPTQVGVVYSPTSPPASAWEQMRSVEAGPNSGYGTINFTVLPASLANNTALVCAGSSAAAYGFYGQPLP